MSKPLIDSVDFRYENTLRIDFNTELPVGLGSSFSSVDEIDDEYKEIDGLKDWTDEALQYYIDLTDRVNDIIYEVLGEDIEIDWRDSSEVEIHNVINDNKVEKLISRINKLK
jgi:hypothetical protein